MPVRPRRGIARRRDERGAVAVITALVMTLLLVATAMVLDFGLVRLDRQDIKATADSAVMSGIGAGDSGGGQLYSHRAVCSALAFARADPRLEGLPDGICATSALAANHSVKCTAATPTHAAYTGTVTSGGATYDVLIKSPYVASEGEWSDEKNFDSVSSDQSGVSGCDQVGVEISLARKPGLGSLATTSDLRTALRSAARATDDPQSVISPALVLLERTSCSVLTVGSAGGGSGTYINVKGVAETPGTIHTDSTATGSDCGSGSGAQLFQGKQASDGIVAYGSPSGAGASGLISSVASFDGVAANVVSDGLDRVYGTPSTSGTGTVKNTVVGRRQVTRSPVDSRYRTAVRTAITAAKGVWDNSAGWTVAGCAPTAAQLTAAKLWVDCDGNSGITLSGEIQASDVYFNGFIKSGTLSMPNATRVYVSNRSASGGGPINSNAISLTNGNKFCVRASCASTLPCPSTPTAGRARVFIRQGSLSATGGVLRMCNSTVIMLDGNTESGCVPATDGLAPVDAACAGALGSSRIEVTGSGALDWTAPNQYSGDIPAPDRAAAWADFEDLATWSETPGSYSFAGSGGMNTVGVYMLPNARVGVGGGSSQTLTNAQYVARTFAVSGGGTLTLSTDPRNAVTIPNPQYVLIR